MLKIVTVLVLLAAVTCHAVPRYWRSNDLQTWDQEQQNGKEEKEIGSQPENGPKEVRKTNWEYAIEHVRENQEKETTPSSEEARRETGRGSESETGSDQQQEEQGEQENQQNDAQRDEVEQIDQRIQAENTRRRQSNNQESARGDSRRGRNGQQRNGNNQNGRREESQEQSAQEAEQTNEPEDQIQEEQEVSEESPQDGSQEQNNEAKGLANYEFSYGVNDPDTGDHKDHWEKRVGDHLEGGYVLALPDGTKRVVQYKTDGKGGFESNIMQIERKKASEKTERRKEKSKNVARSYSKVKQLN